MISTLSPRMEDYEWRNGARNSELPFREQQSDNGGRGQMSRGAGRGESQCHIMCLPDLISAVLEFHTHPPHRPEDVKNYPAGQET